jgi:hypothetical protein
MDWDESSQTLVVLGSAFIVAFCVVMVLFMLDHKRNLYSKQMLIDLYENQCKIETAQLRERVRSLERDVAMLKGLEYIDPDEELDDDDEDEDEENTC